MSESRVTFHRVEEYGLLQQGPTNERSVVCSFKTNRFGYLQVGFDEGGIYELTNEPDLNIIRERDRKYIESAVAIAWRMIFEAPSATERFE